MKISFLCKRSLDSLGRQEINVLRIADATFKLVEYLKLQASLHKILTEILHQKRLTNKHEYKEILSSSKYSKTSFKQSTESRYAILFCKKKRKSLKIEN